VSFIILLLCFLFSCSFECVFDSRVDHIQSFFVISESASAGALQAYTQFAEAGGLQASEDQLMRAASTHASLATAQNYLTRPPNFLQRNGILAQINTLQHKKGPAWIRENGIDRNLGSTNQRSNNNNLTIMLPTSNETAIIDSTQTNVGKVKRMQVHCRGAINYNAPMKDLSPDEQVVQNELKQAVRFYGEQMIRGEDACKAQVIDMIDGTGKDWEKGQSQTEHVKIMNIEGYK
jgi:hypothetical protein